MTIRVVSIFHRTEDFLGAACTGKGEVLFEEKFLSLVAPSKGLVSERVALIGDGAFSECIFAVGPLSV